jgi:CRISPR/Cas system-associated protein endoribonuclease Cas2
MNDVPIDDDAARKASAAEFRAFLNEIGKTQCGFASTLKRIGDTRQKDAIQRHVSRLASGKARISGEMRVIMAIFRKSHRKRRARSAEAAPPTQHV